MVAFAFGTAMAFTTVPTPLWSLYAQRDRFSSLTVTVVFAVYALAFALSLFLAGHLSDWYGRRRVLIPALVLQIVAGVVFVVWPALPAIPLIEDKHTIRPFSRIASRASSLSLIRSCAVRLI